MSELVFTLFRVKGRPLFIINLIEKKVTKFFPMKLFYNKFFWIVDYNVPLTGVIFSFVEKSFLDKVSVLSIVVLYFKFVACAYLGVTTNLM